MLPEGCPHTESVDVNSPGFQPGVYPKYNFDPVGVAQAVILCDPYRVEPPFLPYPGLKPGAIDVHTYGVRAPFGILQIP